MTWFFFLKLNLSQTVREVITQTHSVWRGQRVSETHTEVSQKRKCWISSRARQEAIGGQGGKHHTQQTWCAATWEMQSRTGTSGWELGTMQMWPLAQQYFPFIFKLLHPRFGKLSVSFIDESIFNDTLDFHGHVWWTQSMLERGNTDADRET